MSAILQTILSWFGGSVAVIVGLTGVAYWLFKTFSAKWLETQFSERLEAYKHELSTMLDRATRLHAQEFEVLPNLWQKLSEAMGSAMSILSPLQLSGDITHLAPDELEALLENSTLLEHEKLRVREAPTVQRSPLFNELQMNHRFRASIDTWQDFNNYAVAKAIFLDPVLNARVRELSEIIYQGLDAYRWGQGDKEGRKEIRSSWDKIRTDGIRLRDEIEAAVNGRLRAVSIQPN